MGILEVHENRKVAFLQEAGCTRLIRWREGNSRGWEDSKELEGLPGGRPFAKGAGKAGQRNKTIIADPYRLSRNYL
jgi:hypothetical protein